MFNSTDGERSPIELIRLQVMIEHVVVFLVFCVRIIRVIIRVRVDLARSSLCFIVTSSLYFLPNVQSLFINPLFYIHCRMKERCNKKKGSRIFYNAIFFIHDPFFFMTPFSFFCLIRRVLLKPLDLYPYKLPLLFKT